MQLRNRIHNHSIPDTVVVINSKNGVGGQIVLGCKLTLRQKKANGISIYFN